MIRSVTFDDETSFVTWLCFLLHLTFVPFRDGQFLVSKRNHLTTILYRKLNLRFFLILEVDLIIGKQAVFLVAVTDFRSMLVLNVLQCHGLLDGLVTQHSGSPVVDALRVHERIVWRFISVLHGAVIPFLVYYKLAFVVNFHWTYRACWQCIDVVAQVFFVSGDDNDL